MLSKGDTFISNLRFNKLKMTGRSIDIALTNVEAGSDMEEIYENVCTLTSEPDLSFNYAATEELKKWGFSEGCFTCLLQDKKILLFRSLPHILKGKARKKRLTPMWIT